MGRLSLVVKVGDCIEAVTYTECDSSKRMRQKSGEHTRRQSPDPS